MKSPKLTQSLIGKICKRVRTGMDYAGACTLEGVPKSTAVIWFEKGKATPGIYRDFTTGLAEAAMAFRKFHEELLKNNRSR